MKKLILFFSNTEMFKLKDPKTWKQFEIDTSRQYELLNEHQDGYSDATKISCKKVYDHFEENGELKPVGNWYRGKYDQTENIKFYCKSAKCKSKGVHSLKTESIRFHCAECVADLLVRHRKGKKDVKVPIQFKFDDWYRSHYNDNIPSGGLIISYDYRRGKFTINGQIVDAELVDHKPTEPLMAPCRLIVRNRFTINGKYLTGDGYHGYFDMTRCRNLNLGKPCASIAKTYTPQGYIAKTIPQGTPGWVENSEGQIILHSYCPECAKILVSNKKPKPKPWDSWKTKPWRNNDQIERLKGQLINLLDENTKLKSELSQAQNEIRKLKLREQGIL